MRYSPRSPGPGRGTIASSGSTKYSISRSNSSSSSLGCGGAGGGGGSSAGIRTFDMKTSPASVTFEVDKPAGRAYTCRIEVQDRLHDPIGVAAAVEITDCVRS